MIFRRLIAFLVVASLLAAPSLAADKKPLVLGTSGQQQQIQSGDTLSVPNAKVTSITGSTQCVQASSAGLLSGTGSACGSGGGGSTSYSWAHPDLTTTSTSGDPSAATYGNCLNMLGAITVYGITFTASLVSGATYVGEIYLLNSSLVIQGSVLGTTSTYTATSTGTGEIVLSFSSPVVLSALNYYAFAISRTDATDTTALNLFGLSTGSSNVWASLPAYDGTYYPGRYCYLAKKSPAAGNTFSQGSGAWEIGLKFTSQ